MLPQYIVYITVFTSLFAGYFYIRDTLKGETKPNRVSWLIWFLAPILASIAQWQNGSGISSLPIFMSGFVPLLVILVSFKNPNAYWKLNVLDYICLILSLFSLISLFYFKVGFWATLFAILADAIAFFPTYIKSWQAPDTETVGPYYSGSFNALLALITLNVVSFNTAGFATYLFFGNFAEIVILWVRRRTLPKL